MSYTYTFSNINEAVSATDMESVANNATYYVASGAAQTYSVADLTVTVAAGVIVVNGTEYSIAEDTVTLVADGSNPRWALIWGDDAMAYGITHGSAAATPLVPSLAADQTMIAKVLVDAALTIANDATVKLDKRAPGPGVDTRITISSSEPSSPSAGELWVDITTDTYPLVYVARDDGA